MIRLLSLILFSTSLWAKLIIISDIDDTLRPVNTTNKKAAIKELLMGIKPFPAARELLWATKLAHETQGEEVVIYYLSASYKFIYNAQKWLANNDFPVGVTIQKKLIIDPLNSARYKAGIVADILRFEGVDNTILMLGDSGQLDAKAYEIVRDQLQLKKSSIYIRDLGDETPYYSREARYFYSEKEILEDDLFKKISAENKVLIQEQSTIAAFVRRNLAKNANECSQLLLSLLR